MWLREATASQEIFLGPFLDTVDADTEETGLTIANTDIKLRKHGATAGVNKNSGGGTHDASGMYSAVLDATDTDTLGNLVVSCHVSGALYVKETYIVLPANVFDSLVLGTDLVDVNVAQWLGTAAATPTTAGIPEVDVTHVSGVAEDISTATALSTLDDFVDTEVAAILALLDDARAEPGQGAPPVNPDLATKIDYLYKAWRNKSTQTATTYSLYDDAGTVVDQKATVSDDGTTATVGEIATGP